MFGGLACALAVVVWWLFFSRAPWADRVGAIVLMIVAVVAAKRVVHKCHAFGLAGGSLACIDLKDGERKWKGGS